MAFDPGLAQRVREVLGERPGITERRMFGGLAFMVHGRMFVGVQAASLMARVGPERHDDALAMPGVRVMDFTGRPMKGFVFVSPAACDSEEAIAAWVEWGAKFVARLNGAQPIAPPRPNRQRR